jgi:uncharacterized Tic20 family protein
MTGSWNEPQDPNASPPAGPPSSGPPPTGPYGGVPPPPGPYGPPPGAPYGYAPGSQLSPNDERNWAIAAHLSTIVIQFLGPLLVMLIQGPKSPFVRAHAVEALNFNISVTIYFVVSFILVFAIVGLLLMPAVLITWLVCTIIATVKASKGEFYRYPLTIRLVT